MSIASCEVKNLLISSSVSDQVRAGDQPQDRQGAGPRRVADAHRPRRRGDRLKCCNPWTAYLAVHESVVGTKRTSSGVRLESAFVGKAELGLRGRQGSFSPNCMVRP